MGIVFRQSIKTSIITLTGAVMGAGIIFLHPYALNKSEVGLVVNIIFTAAIVQCLVMLGLSNTIATFTQRYDVHDERRKMLFTLGLMVTLAASLIFAVIFLMLKEPVINMYDPAEQPLLRKYYFLIPVLVIFWSLTSLIDHYLTAHVKIAASAFAREILLRFLNLVLFALLYFGLFSVHQFIYGSVFVYIIPLIVVFIIASRTQGFGMSLNFSVFSRKEYRDIIHFAWFHVLMVVSLNILNFIDTLMLGPLDSKGIESAGVYSRAALIAGMMVMPFRAMAVSSMPILNQAYIERDKEKVKNLFTRAGVNILIASVGMFIIMAPNLDNAVKLLPDGYENVKPLVLILMIGKLIDTATGLNNELISLSVYYKFNFYLAGFLVVMVYVLDRIFIPPYGIFGAAWVATASLAIFNIIKMIFLYRKMRLHPFTNRSFLVLVAGALAAAVGYIIPYIGNPFLDAAVRSLIIVIAYFLLLLLFKPSEDLLAYVTNIRQNKRLF